MKELECVSDDPNNFSEKSDPRRGGQLTYQQKLKTRLLFIILKLVYYL